MFSYESPYRGDSNECTQYTISNIKEKIALNFPKYAALRFFPRIQERVRNSRGKRAISVRATEGQLCSVFLFVCLFLFVSVERHWNLALPKEIQELFVFVPRQHFLNLGIEKKSHG